MFYPLRMTDTVNINNNTAEKKRKREKKRKARKEKRGRKRRISNIFQNEIQQDVEHCLDFINKANLKLLISIHFIDPDTPNS